MSSNDGSPSGPYRIGQTRLFEELDCALQTFPAEAAAIAGVYVIAVPPHRYLLDLTAQPATARELDAAEDAPHGVPAVRYRDAAAFEDVLQRKVRPEVAWARGLMSMDGDMAKLAKLRHVFGLLKRYREGEEGRARIATPHTPASHAASGPALSTSRRSLPASIGLASPDDALPPSLRSPTSATRHSGTLQPLDKGQWQPDSAACALCPSVFSLAQRRHHCRFCGLCVCNRCSVLRLEGLRVCDACVRSATHLPPPTPVALTLAPRSLEHAQHMAVLPSSAASTPGFAATEHPTRGGVANGVVALSAIKPYPHDDGHGHVLTNDMRQSSAAHLHAPPSAGLPAAAVYASSDTTLPPSAAGSRGPLRHRGRSHSGEHPQHVPAAAVVQELEGEVFGLRESVAQLEAELKALREEAVGRRAARLHTGWNVGVAVAVLTTLLGIVLASYSPVAIAAPVPLLSISLWVAAAGAVTAAVAVEARTHVLRLWLRRLRAVYTAVTVLLQLRSLRNRTASMSDEQSQPLWDMAHAVNARFAYEQMLRLKAFWLKVAQYVAARADVFPPPYVRELTKLQDSTEATPFAAVRRLVQRELRIGSLEDVFASFDPVPLASASIAQVHRARLCVPVRVRVPVARAAGASTATAQASRATFLGAARDDSSSPAIDAYGLVFEEREISDVVVKVQHEGVDAVMRSDLTTLDAIVRAVAWLEKDFDFRPVMREWSREAIKELDFRREAAITVHVGRVLAAAGAHARVPTILDVRQLVAAAMSSGSGASGAAASRAQPAVGTAAATAMSTDLASFLPDEINFATARVMVMEYVDGLKVTDVEGLQRRRVDCSALVADVCEAFAVQMHCDGVFSGDPHSGNILVELPPAAPAGAAAVSAGPHTPTTTPGLLRALPVLLDFGLSKVLPDTMRLAFCRMICAAHSADSGALLDAFDCMGLTLNREAPGEDLEAIQFLMRDTRPAGAARQQMVARRKVWVERAQKRRAAKQKRPVDSWPPDLLFYLRTSEMLHGLGAKLGAQLQYGAILVKHARAAVRAHAAGAWLAAAGGATAAAADSASAADGVGAVVVYSADAADLRVPPAGTRDIAIMDARRIRSVAACCAAGAPVAATGPLAELRPGSVPRPLPIAAALAMPLRFRCGLEERLYGTLRQLWIAGDISGCQVAVYRRGQLVADAAYGELGPLDPRPMRPSTLVNCFSVTKGVTATLLHILMQQVREEERFPPADAAAAATSAGQGRNGSATSGSASASAVAESLAAEYALPVAALWPAFADRAGEHTTPSAAAPGAASTLAPQAATVGMSRRQAALAAAKRQTTIADIMSHRAGLQHALPSSVSMATFPCLQHMMEAMEAAVPSHTPGSHTSYHYYSFGWLAAGIMRGLVERLLRKPTAPAGTAGSVAALATPHLSDGASAFSVGPLVRELIAHKLGHGAVEELMIGVPAELLAPAVPPPPHAAGRQVKRGVASSASSAAAELLDGAVLGTDRVATLSGSLFDTSAGGASAAFGGASEMGAGAGTGTGTALLPVASGDAATQGAEGRADESSAASSALRLARLLEMAERFAADAEGAGGHDGQTNADAAQQESGAVSHDTGGSGDAAGGSAAGGEEDSLQAAERALKGLDQARRHDLQALSRLILSLRERLYLLDPRLFNRPAFRRGEIPAANGHFTARALARFYACLGQPLYLARCRAAGSSVPGDLLRLPSLLPLARLRYVTRIHSEEAQQLNLYVQGGWRTRFGLGYQVFLPTSAEAEGHSSAGVTARGGLAVAASPETAPPSLGSAPRLRRGSPGVGSGKKQVTFNVPPSSAGGSEDLLPTSHSAAPTDALTAAFSTPPRPRRSTASDSTSPLKSGATSQTTASVAARSAASRPGAAAGPDTFADCLPFGHSGFGGSLAFYDPTVDVAVAITVNQLSTTKSATTALLREVLASEGCVRFAVF